MTGLIAMTTNVKQVYALRTFLGVMESSAYPGTVTLLMAWYTPHELALRISFYHSCQAIGSMMSNALQSAIHSTLEGKAGLEGWRWLFVSGTSPAFELCLTDFCPGHQRDNDRGARTLRLLYDPRLPYSP